MSETQKPIKSMRALIKHQKNHYILSLEGISDDTDLQMIDPKGNGEFFLIMDALHPIGIIFNEGEMDFRGFSLDKGGE